MVKKLGNIIVGWYRLLFGIHTQESRRRYSICLQCEYKTKIGKEWFCSKCYCDCDAKSRVETERCPLEKW